MNPNLFRTKRGKRKLLLPLLFLLSPARPAWTQDTAREHFQLKIGTAYDRGDYGSTQTTLTRYLPVTFRYFGERFDISVAPTLAMVDAPAGVVLIDGVPTPIGTASSTQGTQYGAGDTLLRAHYYLLEGTTSRPSITPFAKMKIPTAPESLNLSTGKTDVGFGMEWISRFHTRFYSGTSATRSSVRLRESLCEIRRAQVSESDKGLPEPSR